MAQPEPSEKSVKRMEKFVASYCTKSGTATHPDPEVTEAVVKGLAANADALGKPLCPCRFYPDKQAEIQHRTWICACDDMQIYKYCHCLLFVTPDGMPITEYLPEDHEGRQMYGVIKDPTPEKGRPLRDKAAEREIERRQRPS
jgi:ferredoxin-thioredoxin reductase catalytic chain